MPGKVFHLAQLNIARMKFEPEDPGLKDFMDALDPVNRSAEQSPGFVWRLVSSENGSPELQEFESKGWLVNMSVWESLEDFRAFFSSGQHLAIMRRRAEWFTKSEKATAVAWRVKAGEIPTFTQAIQRLELLREKGPCVEAFHFSRPFDPPS